VTVENHPGAGGTAAPALVAQLPVDGYSLLVNTSAQAYSAALLKNLPYDPLNDFISVAPLTSQSYVLVASTSSGITSVRDLIAAAKAKPSELKFGSAGIGTGTHLGAEKFNLAAGIKAVHVPGNTTPEAIADTVVGRTTYLITPISYALADIRAGRLRALGVTTNTRSPLLSEVPTIAEAGVTGFDYPIWYGVWVRAGTPAGVVDKLAKDIARVLAAPDMRDWLAKHGADPMSMTQPEFAHFVVSESENAARIVEAAGIGYWGATEQKTRLRIQVTSTIEPDGLRSGRNWGMAMIRDRLGHMTATQRLGSTQYSSGTIFALFAGRG
jgi:tripartite-type tricarboxylate transporter receptor subunit TctC